MTNLAGTTERIRGALVAALLLGGCASEPGRPPPSAAAGADPAVPCRTLFRELDERISAAGIRDAQSAPVPGFPYLRIDRFHAALEPGATGPAFDAWVDRLRDLDRRARRAEIANLASPDNPPAARLDECAEILRARDLSDPQRRAGLIGARVKDAYQPWLRVLGLYPLTALPFLLGVRNLHRETAAAFATALDELPREGELTRYAPPPGATLDTAEVAAILARAATNPLAIPDPADEDLQVLFETFAPRFDIDSASAADLPGRPALGPSAPRVDGPATVFTLTSFARWRGRILLQLNYLLWFPARPRESRLDLVGGNLDGITWRVTLGMDGRPLLFDSMHNCGCYYKAFPTRGLAARRPRGFEEPLSVPQSAPDGGGAMVLRVSAGRHYLQRLYRVAAQASAAAPVRTYAFADYDALRALPRPGGGSRSLFGRDGIVAGTERAERWLFWPMGVPEPGAMRQWGHHAIAFVGRRHFDDPGLLERYFQPAEDAGDSEEE